MTHHEIFVDRDNDIEDVSAGYEESTNSTSSDTRMLKIMPGNMPWCGMLETNFRTAQLTDGKVDMDSVPVQYELHSNTKSHQLGGFYESYSRSDPPTA